MDADTTNSLIHWLRNIDSDALTGIIAILGGFTVAIVAIVGSNIAETRARREREETKRELAAYVAEGSLSLDQAERLICADLKSGRKERRSARRRDETRTAESSAT
jgi:hypothetical protein